MTQGAFLLSKQWVGINTPTKHLSLQKAAKQLSEDSQQSEAVREEALKTYNRIMWNKR